MKKRNRIILYLSIFSIAVLIIWGVGNISLTDSSQLNAGEYDSGYDYSPDSRNSGTSGAVSFYRDINTIDYSGVQFTPWDVAAASANISKHDPKAYTIMIYMNGSDLESENGAATDDIIEMLDSGLDTGLVNVIIFTGGTKRWQNDVIPENECVLWKLSDGCLEELAGVGLVNMGDPGTLSSFIDFSMNNYPAEKYGLVLWDHGGGSIAGYGHDEKFNNSNLNLLDLDYAFRRSGLDKNRLEFLGFDSCLMASVEMAVVASPYAEWLVASEDLEPGGGWDYSFLSALNAASDMDGAELGMTITDYFMDFYGADTDEFLTMSVTDLSKANMVMDAMGKLMDQCSDDLLSDREASFATFYRRRFGTKTFGDGSPRDNECDMVDAGDMARKLADIFPMEAAGVISSLNEAVVYNRHNSDINLKGLSAYYIYGGKDTANYSLPTYASLKMSDDYTEYLYRFAGILNGATGMRSSTKRSAAGSTGPSDEELVSADLAVWEPVGGKEGYYMMTGLKNGVNKAQAEEAVAEALWPVINGERVCMYPIGSSGERSLYAAPAVLNGRDCDIIILFSSKHPDGKVLGARQADGFIIQKGHDKLKQGDKLSFYYREMYFGGDRERKQEGWQKSAVLTVDDELIIDWVRLNGEDVYYSLILTDIYRNEYYTDIGSAQE